MSNNFVTVLCTIGIAARWRHFNDFIYVYRC